MLYRIIYVSRPTADFDNSDLRTILEASRRNNPRLGVSGALLFNSGFFLQWLEGGRQSINERFATIMRDPRHQQVEILNYEPITCREFSDWAMGYLGEGAFNAKLFYKFSNLDHFDPYLLSSESAVAFLLEARRNSYELK